MLAACFKHKAYGGGVREDDNNQEILALFDGVSEGQGQLRALRQHHILGPCKLRRLDS